jgi:hypothetical protein
VIPTSAAPIGAADDGKPAPPLPQGKQQISRNILIYKDYSP